MKMFALVAVAVPPKILAFFFAEFEACVDFLNWEAQRIFDAIATG